MDGGIFVSYSHHDMDSVQEIVTTLKAESGHKVWYDNRLRGGEEFYDVIANEILKNEYFVFIVSEHSIASDWCLQELEFAMSEKRTIISIWLKEVPLPPRVRLVIQNRHDIRWYCDNARQFAYHIQCTFSDDADRISQKPNFSEEKLEMQNEKYFVLPNDRKTIKMLLAAEEKDEYTTCFEARHAVLLGLAYELGMDVEKDQKKAEFYYKVASFKQDEDGKYLYAARMLEQEENKPEIADRDTAKMKQYLEAMKEAAEHGSIYAMTYYGDVLYHGLHGMPKNQELAYAWWKKGADQNFPVCQYFMSWGYRWGETVAKDAGIALMYALSASEYKFPRAFRMLGFLYREGEFVETDTVKAKEYFETAVTYGDYLSLCYIGDLYYDEGQFEEANRYYQEAVSYADSGIIQSGTPYYEWGYALYAGKGVAEHLEEAISYYLKGAARKQKSCCEDVVSMICELPCDAHRIQLLERACELGCEGAEYHLARSVKSVKIRKT